MNKKYLAITFAAVFALLVVLNLIGALRGLNQPINAIISPSADRSCITDADCALVRLECYSGIRGCDCGGTSRAVNADWAEEYDGPYCPFVNHNRLSSVQCDCFAWRTETVCEENRCTTVRLDPDVY